MVEIDRSDSIVQNETSDSFDDQSGVSIDREKKLLLKQYVDY